MGQCRSLQPFVSWINRVTRPFWYWCERWLPLTMRHFSAYFSLLLVIFGQALIPASVRSINLFLQGMIEVDALALQFGGHLIQSTSIIAQSVFFFFMLILGFWFFLTLINPAYNNPIVQVLHTLQIHCSPTTTLSSSNALRHLSSNWCGALLSTQRLCCTSYRLLRWDAIPTGPTLCLLTLQKNGRIFERFLADVNPN